MNQGRGSWHVTPSEHAGATPVDDRAEVINKGLFQHNLGLSI
jgi:hypothetical protein